MKYEFPTINNIDDVLPHVEDDPRFVVARKDVYDVINYVRYDNETFTGHPIRRECRGLIFDKETGDIISRPFHKFFNVGENEDVQAADVDITRPHTILHKVDGSMVRPLRIGGGIRWGTKMGITDVSMQAELFVQANPQISYDSYAKSMIIMGLTPIFEWVSRSNRIVLDYEEDALILLAARDNKTGEYASYERLQYIARAYDVPVVEEIPGTFANTEELVKAVKEYEDAEGIVLRFDDGNMLKVKSDWYVNLHRIKSAVSDTRKLVRCILEDQVDDLYPILPEKERDEIKEFVEEFWTEIEYEVCDLAPTVDNIVSNQSRKDFALSDRAKNMHPAWRALIFQCWDFEDIDGLYVTAREKILQTLKNNCSNTKKFEETSFLFGDLKWSGGMFG